jgi:hypothetical protein
MLPSPKPTSSPTQQPTSAPTLSPLADPSPSKKNRYSEKQSVKYIAAAETEQLALVTGTCAYA